MKLSTKSRYGTRILIDLARHGKNGPVQIGEVSKRQGVSIKYLEQVIRPLKEAGLVESQRGPKGGHTLAVDPRKISLGKVVRLLETHSHIVDCITEPESCSISEDCRVRKAWQSAVDAFYKELDSVTVASLAKGKGPEPGEEGSCI